MASHHCWWQNSWTHHPQQQQLGDATQKVRCILKTPWEGEGLERMIKQRQGGCKTYKLLWISNATSVKYRKGVAWTLQNYPPHIHLDPLVKMQRQAEENLRNVSTVTLVLLQILFYRSWIRNINILMGHGKGGITDGHATETSLF